MRLKGKVAFITGGSTGIGLAICKRFLQEGAKIALISRSQDKLNQAKHILDQDVLALSCSVTDSKGLKKVYEQVDKHFGKIDILVANAGIYERKHLSLVTEQDFDRMVDTNFKGVYFTVQKGLNHLNDDASILLIASIAGHRGAEEGSLYGATKAAVQFLAKAFSADLISRSIRVNAISPGYIQTPMIDAFKSEDPEAIEKLAQRIPTKKVAEAEEIASLAVYLGSNESKYIVGQNITIDGGITSIAPPRNLSTSFVSTAKN